ncbi:MAG: M10 family metallopeptidase C-terminal domain-containing protein [Mesorhizobium sp.]|nr:M10 family metallopeptidase C-terminal domain-containing protein [Mesorhizobium sp.]
MPDVIETTDAAASTATLYQLNVGQTGQGTINPGGDHDWWRVDLVAGQTYTFALVGTGGNHLGDPYLRLLNASGVQIVVDDDGGPGANSTITFTATSTGTFYLDAAGFNATYQGQYGISATLGSRANYDTQMGAGNLIRDGYSWSATPGTGVNVTWSVSTSNPSQTDASGNPTPFIAPSAAQIAAVQASLLQFSEASNITFTQINPGGTSNESTIRVSSYSSTTDGAGAYAYFPGSTDPNSLAGNVNLNNQSVSTTSLPQGSYSFFAVLHELGHSMGLAHPGDYNAAPGVNITYNTHAQFTQDSHQYSVMSYFDESNTTASYNSYPDTLMMYDILALQQLYGINYTTRAGNSIYGFNANTGATYDFTINTTPAFCIWDGGGIDTLDASGYAQSQLLDLRDGYFSDIGGYAGNVSIAIGAIIENAVGGSGNDFLIGNAAANILTGNAGADTLDGGGGNDVLIGGLGADTLIGGAGVDAASYQFAAIGVMARLDLPALNTGEATGDTYSGIEDLIGSAFADTLVGNGGGNTIEGGGGDDRLFGLAGNDILRGGAGNDHLFGGAGADALYGGEGFDVANYGQATAGVYARFDNPALNTGEAAGDTYFEIEALLGSAFVDTLVGDANANYIDGQGGNDTIHGLAGNDTLRGGAGNDHLFGGLGADALYGDDGFDVANYGQATAGVTARLDLPNLNTGEAAGDTYFSIEGLIGSGFADTLVGDGNANHVYGQGGNDTLLGLGGDDVLRGGAGNDQLFGGAGADALYGDDGFDVANYGQATAGVTARLDNPLLNTGEAAGDTYFSIEAVLGSGFADTLAGDGNANHVYGQGGNDMIFGLGGDDVLRGGAGDDILSGGTGNDTLFGDAGADSFEFHKGDMFDIVQGFEDDIDTLLFDDDLWGGGLSVAEMLATFATQGADFIDFIFGDGDVLRVNQAGITIAALENDIMIV